MRVLPPLQRAPGSRRNFGRGMPEKPNLVDLSQADANEGTNKLTSGTTPTAYIANKPAAHDRVLFPTQIKETFLMRNKHLASQKMAKMAIDIADFAKRAGVNAQ